MKEDANLNKCWENALRFNNFLISRIGKNDLAEILDVLTPFSNSDDPEVSFCFADVGIKPGLGRSLWYYGAIATLFCNGKAYYLMANGDVRGSIHKTGIDGPIHYFSNRTRYESIQEQIADYAKTDEDLIKLFSGKSVFQVEFEENNWWEMIPADPHDIRAWLLGDDTLAGALSEAAELLTSGKVY